jgi:CheY-like chemotaxis protein
VLERASHARVRTTAPFSLRPLRGLASTGTPGERRRAAAPLLSAQPVVRVFQAGTMTQKLVLIADDNEDNRIVFTAILEHSGYAVLSATHGAEAVEQARQHAPDLVLLDIAMPVMDGWETIGILKADESTASIPVLAVSAFDIQEERVSGAGFCAFVRKPVEPRALLAAVTRCLEETARGETWIDLDGHSDFGIE